jgi:hypothetical protein
MLLAACLVGGLCLSAAPGSTVDDTPAAGSAVATQDAGGIAWFGRLEDAAAEAERSGRPILLMSAAPQCSGAPGMW